MDQMIFHIELLKAMKIVSLSLKNCYVNATFAMSNGTAYVIVICDELRILKRVQMKRFILWN